VNYLETIKNQLIQYELELTNQSQLCPITKLSSNEIDNILKEYVDCQRKQLSSKKHRQLIRFKEDFHEKQLLHTLSTYRLTNEQVSLEFQRKTRKIFSHQIILFFSSE
jgi:hypothetical protein